MRSDPDIVETQTRAIMEVLFPGSIVATPEQIANAMSALVSATAAILNICFEPAERESCLKLIQERLRGHCEETMQ